MNIELLKKAGPILGLIVSLSTTSFAGYKIFAAPLEHKSQVPSLPDPTPTSESEQEEIVETIYIDEPVSVTNTPTPKVTPASVSARGTGAASLGSTGATGARGGELEDEEDDHDEDREEDHDEFDDDSDDTLTITQHDRKDDHETPTPTQKPENR